MNLPVYTTDTLLLDTYQGESILQMVVHTILFHRWVTRRTRPKEVTNPIFDTLVYVKMDDEEIERYVSEQVARAMETIKEKATGTVALLFYRVQPASGWFRREERVEVEKWRIPIQWYEPYDKSVRLPVKEQRVRSVYDSLLRMLMSVSLEPIPFHQEEVGHSLPFDVVDADKSSSLKDMLHFIVSGPPKLGLF
jgi:hypothetical protein